MAFAVFWHLNCLQLSELVGPSSEAIKMMRICRVKENFFFMFRFQPQEVFANIYHDLQSQHKTGKQGEKQHIVQFTNSIFQLREMIFYLFTHLQAIFNCRKIYCVHIYNTIQVNCYESDFRC